MADELRARLVRQVMIRDRLDESAAKRIVNGLHHNELIRLELEAREHAAPAFTADYDPYAR
jgi:hypothetical protein